MAVEDTKYTCVAAIFGVTGLVGKELARMLLATRKWKVYGIARRPDNIETVRQRPGYHFISCDLLSPLETQSKLPSLLEDTTHIFWVTWASQFTLDSSECYEQNKAMMANVLNAVLPKAKALKHVSLQTGTKHYVSLQGSFLGKEVGDYDEKSPRVTTGYNFYYALEDLLQDRLPCHKVAWTIHRPRLIMGCSRTTLYNFVGSICVYGTICKYLKLPFLFGGTKGCWEEMCVDASDARLVAEQHVWAATSDDPAMQRAESGQAFNAVNGEPYSWKEIWPAIGAKLGVGGQEKCTFSGDLMFSSAMADKGGVWKEIVVKEGLVHTEMEELANWDFLDILFRCPMKMLASRQKADLMGFKTRYHVLDSILYWIDVMRAEKFIP
ncbi:UNVERIFIED_CONTAM: 3-oxo-Delta(4,5)-steroid 5-beta-reductase [Sesamum calycinum]|uniref:3-oxo-Delta(4,5)-steroid 5-beta-reductase n=1 Tax=Sesamum calycinum TaxID=2727403 RepID=A0AAW2J1U6_9LAMI